MVSRMEQQQREMRRCHPSFKLLLDAGLWAVWEGPLRPSNLTYTIRIVYFPWRVTDGFVIENSHVAVTVVNPAIGLDPRGTKEPAPHIYPNPANPTMPKLCLFDPLADEWGPEQLLAHTIVLWAAQWLFCFEGWQATGHWYGGGRHPGKAEARTPRASVASAALNSRSLVAFHRLGRRTGSTASTTLLSAAAEGTFPPWSWLTLSDDVRAANQSPALSTTDPWRGALDRAA